MADFCIVGGGGHARVLISCLVSLRHEVRGYIAPQTQDDMTVAYLGSDQKYLTMNEDAIGTAAVMGIGKTTVSSSRLQLMNSYQAVGFNFPPLYARAATVHDDVISGNGSVVLDGAVLVTGSRLGRACIINTHATVDHDCLLGDDVHVAPGATLSGGVRIGDHCLIGTGANLIQSVKICPGVLIGAGATVIEDINEPGVYVGSPARRIA